jgi:hypothetical protein
VPHGWKGSARSCQIESKYLQHATISLTFTLQPDYLACSDSINQKEKCLGNRPYHLLEIIR